MRALDYASSRHRLPVKRDANRELLLPSPRELYSLRAASSEISNRDFCGSRTGCGGFEGDVDRTTRALGHARATSVGLAVVAFRHSGERYTLDAHGDAVGIRQSDHLRRAR